MAQLIRGLDAARVRRNVAGVQQEISAAASRSGRDPDAVELLAATKYIAAEDMPVLARAGVTLVGENRAQDLDAKVAAHGPLFHWDFIGVLQSRKVRRVLPHVRMIHSLGTDSALRELDRHIALARPDLEVLVEVNLAAEGEKAGVAPARLDEFIGRCPVAVTGLMTMPPLAESAQQSRAWFAALRGLATERGLHRLSMGTTQDFAVAVEEGATIVRVGSRLYR